MSRDQMEKVPEQCKSIQEDDVKSDQYLLKATIRLKMRKTPSQNIRKSGWTLKKIKIKDVDRAFESEKMKNRFSVLDNTDTRS